MIGRTVVIISFLCFNACCNAPDFKGGRSYTIKSDTIIHPTKLDTNLFGEEYWKLKREIDSMEGFRKSNTNIK